MTSVQERLQLKRVPVDKWSVREQLCLASAVSCSGDQNWMSVSRSLKMLCGSNRPADWFSQKSCAVQYGELLENVETPKRKKRTASERDNQTAETPTESILRKLTQERVSELKAIIQQEQEDYSKMRDEILAVQNGSLDESQLREMWVQIELETEQKALEKRKYEQWLKEREERKIEMQRAPRPSSFQSIASQQKPPQLNLVVKAEEIEVDDNSSKQGTSPLLTSLLKSPATTPTAASSPTNVRVTAPTITNLLIGNSTKNVTSCAPGTAQHFQLMQNQPLTGPNPIEAHPQLTPSPSQAAPTLSMLLENKQGNKASTSVESTVAEIKSEDVTNNDEAMETEDGNESPNKDEDQQLMDVFNGLIPDNIDELAEILTNNNAIILNSELLEEVSILENVDSLIDEQEDITDTTALEQDESKPELQTSKNLTDSIDTSKVKDEIKQENEDALDTSAIPKIEDSSGGGFQGPTPIVKSEEKSTPDWTNLNTTESDVQETTPEANSESNEKDPLKEPIEDNDDDVQIIEPMEDNEEKKSILPVVVKDDEHEENSMTSSDQGTENHEMQAQSVDSKDDLNRDDSETKEESGDQVMITVGDDSDNSNQKMETSQEEQIKSSDENQLTTVDDSPMTVTDTTSENAGNNTLLSDNNATITIIDTDDDSPIEVIKEDKVGKTKRDYSRKKSEISDRKIEDLIDENRLTINIRKLKDRDGSESPFVDDETSDSIPRTRRRYSSTPNIDSIPNSPASSDDREFKAWRKSILMVYNRISTHKYATIFSRTMSDDELNSYKETVLRPMDLQTIKRNIETGLIRSTAEFHRDVMLMCQNAIMFNNKENNVYSMAKEMISETGLIIESVMDSARKESDQRSAAGSISSMKNRGRKSTRLP